MGLDSHILTPEQIADALMEARPLLIKVAIRRLPPQLHREADDVVDAAIANVYQHAKNGSLTIASSLNSYAIQAVRNGCTDKWRAWDRERRAGNQELDQLADKSDAFAAADILSTIEDVCSPDEAQLFLRYHLGQESLNDIAEDTGWSTTSVHRIVTFAGQKLNAALSCCMVFVPFLSLVAWTVLARGWAVIEIAFSSRSVCKRVEGMYAFDSDRCVRHSLHRGQLRCSIS